LNNNNMIHEKQIPEISAMITFHELALSIDHFESNYQNDITEQLFFGYPIEPILKAEHLLREQVSRAHAYFSMEFALTPSIYHEFQTSKEKRGKNQFVNHEVFTNCKTDNGESIRIDKILDLPIYSGGLGVLAGDLMKGCADSGLPIIGVGVLWNKGYFKPKFWLTCGQINEELKWDPYSYPGLIPMKQTVGMDTNEGYLNLRIWKYYVFSYDKKMAWPILLIDTHLPENKPVFHELSDQLYRSDHEWWKIFQRIVLGIGGMRALKEFNYEINSYHLNEGHAGFAILEYLKNHKSGDQNIEEQENFIYTCHTPVEAGHDHFKLEEIRKILPEPYVMLAKKMGSSGKDDLYVHMTEMSLKFCKNINAVAQKHGIIMRSQFDRYKNKIKAITNGVHTQTWVSKNFADLYDKYLKKEGDWRSNSDLLSCLGKNIENETFRKELFYAHQANKRTLVELLQNWNFDEHVLTLGWARRIAGYKRPSLIFHDVERLVKLIKHQGPLQIILAGKAHPNDEIGTAHIEEMMDHIEQLVEHKDQIKVILVENYDTYLGKLLTSSVDVWLNTPIPPFEASGTSGMKAILNGVLQLSSLDGWVVEAEDKDIGWIFGHRHEGAQAGDERDLKLDEDAQALYNTLEEVIELYYKTNNGGVIDSRSLWIDKMIHCVTASAYFSSQRMVEEYNRLMWKAIQ